jgi:hypothetical protein
MYYPWLNLQVLAWLLHKIVLEVLVKIVEVYKYRELVLWSHVNDMRGEYIALKFRSYIKKSGSGKI